MNQEKSQLSTHVNYLSWSVLAHQETQIVSLEMTIHIIL